MRGMKNDMGKYIKNRAYILHTIHGNVDAEIVTSKSAQTIIRILTRRSTPENLRAKSALLVFNEECIRRNANINRNLAANLEGVKTINIIEKFLIKASSDGKLRSYSSHSYLISFISKQWPCK